MQNLKTTPATYIRLALPTRTLSETCFRRIERYGVECLQEGGPFEAYGIIANVDDVIWALLDDPMILHVERKEPPSGM